MAYMAYKETELNLPAEEKVTFNLHKLVLTLFVAGLIAVLSSSAMYNPYSPPTYRLPVAGALLTLILLLSGFRIGKFSMWRLISLFVWTGFAIMSFLSAMNHRDPLLPEAWLFFGVPLIIFTAFPRTANRYGIIMVLSATVLAFGPFIAASLILHPVYMPYAGVFVNTPMFGMIMATFSAALFSLLRGALNHRKMNFINLVWECMLGFGIVVSFILILFSGSRTGFTSFVTIYLIFVGSLFFDISKNRVAIMLAVTGFVAIFGYLLYSLAMDASGNSVMDTLVRKFLNKTVQGDVLGGRVNIWKGAVEDIKILGMGASFFYDMPAHNDYVMILATKGPVTVFFAIAVRILALYLALRWTFFGIRQDGYALGPLLMIINFLILGLAENAGGTLGNGINMTFLLMAGILFNQGQYLR